MRKIQNIAFVLLATLFAGCINDHIENTLCRDGVLRIDLSTGAAGTRADGVNDDGGDSDYPAESTIYDVQFFLYPSGSSEDTDATYAGIIEVTPNTKPDHDTTNQTVTIPADVINTLCPTEGSKCEIYVIVNYLDQVGTNLTKDLTKTSRDELKALPLNTTFLDLDESSLNFRFGPRSFVMDSEVFEVTRGTGDNKNVLTSETIYVTRAAAKILLEVNVQSAIDVSGVTWQPVTEVADANQYYMELAFYNGVKEGVIDDNSDTDPTGKDIQATTSDPYYHLENVELGPGGISNDIVTPETSATRAASKAFTPYVMIYSYTTSWADNDADAPHFKLSIPWRKVAAGQDDNASWVTYDYTVPIALKSNQLVRNKLYVIRLTVGALGDLNYLDESVYSYVVLDWDDVSMNAELARPTYLVVDKNYVVMNNVESIGVGYKSSDPVTVTILSSTIGNDNYAVYDDHTAATASGEITLSHELDNTRSDTDKTYDYLPQTVVVRVAHTNNPDIYEDITFIQYPALYYIADPGDSDANNNVMINANGSYGSGGSANGTLKPWETVGISSTGYSTLYEINVSSFDATTANYLIADPRVPSNSTAITSFASYNRDGTTILADNIEKDVTGDSTINGYRGSITGDIAENLVAPSFIIASACGTYKHGDSRIYAETSGYYRCASYQEYGYPAGRWRIPTPAELNVVGKLCAEGKIPETIFIDRVVYMSSNGPYTYSETNGTFTKTTSQSYSGSIRCLYDTWYWQDKCTDYSDFVWGAEGDDLEAKRAAGYLTVIK